MREGVREEKCKGRGGEGRGERGGVYRPWQIMLKFGPIIYYFLLCSHSLPYFSFIFFFCMYPFFLKCSIKSVQ